MMENSDGWILGQWNIEDITSVENTVGATDPDCEWIWICIETERPHVHCTSVDGANFYLSTVKYALKANHIRWWWKPAGPTPKIPTILGKE